MSDAPTRESASGAEAAPPLSPKPQSAKKTCPPGTPPKPPTPTTRKPRKAMLARGKSLHERRGSLKALDVAFSEEQFSVDPIVRPHSARGHLPSQAVKGVDVATMIATESDIAAAVVANAESVGSGISAQEAEDIKDVLERAALSLQELQKSADWPMKFGLTIGMNVNHATFGQGFIDRVDDGKVHVKFTTGSPRTVPFTERSWKVCFSPVEVASTSSGAGASPPRRRMRRASLLANRGGGSDGEEVSGLGAKALNLLGRGLGMSAAGASSSDPMNRMKSQRREVSAAVGSASSPKSGDAADPSSAATAPPPRRKARRSSLQEFVANEVSSPDALSTMTASAVAAAPPKQKRRSSLVMNAREAGGGFLGGSSTQQQAFFDDPGAHESVEDDGDGDSEADDDSAQDRILRHELTRSIKYLQPLPALLFLVMLPQLIISQSVWLWVSFGAATLVNEAIVLFPLLHIVTLKRSGSISGVCRTFTFAHVALAFILLSLTLNAAEIASSFLGAGWSAQAFLLAYMSTLAMHLPRSHVAISSLMVISAYALGGVPFFAAVSGDAYASYHTWHLDGGGVGLSAAACFPSACDPSLRLTRAAVLAGMWLWLLLPTLLMKEPISRLHELVLLGEKQGDSMISEEDERAAGKILNNILPPSINKLLMDNPGRTIAHEFSACSMMFGYIGGLQSLKMEAEVEDENEADNTLDLTLEDPTEKKLRMLTPLERLDVLNKLVSKIDALTEQYSMEKIKTIGECYMVASGLPIPSRAHAKNLAHFAIAFRKAVEEFQDTMLFYGIEADLYVKIGLATGRAVAGVIGKRQFTYDVFGDTVNISSRMYSNAPKGAIMMSPEMETALCNEIIFDIVPHPDGKIPIKGKGMMATYLLNGIRDMIAMREAQAKQARQGVSHATEKEETATSGPSVTAVEMDDDEFDEGQALKPGDRLRSAGRGRRFSTAFRTGLKRGLKLGHYKEAKISSEDALVAAQALEAAELEGAMTRKPNAREAIGSVLHNEWRKPRLLPSGTYDPRIKTVKNKETGEEVAYDIANLNFIQLPMVYKKSNMDSAHCACQAVEAAYFAGKDVTSSEFMEHASELQHIQWCENNKSWADAELLVPYDDLIEEEKEKDRVIVHIALKEYDKYLHVLYYDGEANKFGLSYVEFAQELARMGAELRAQGILSADADLLELDTKSLIKWLQRERPQGHQDQGVSKMALLITHVKTSLIVNHRKFAKGGMTPRAKRTSDVAIRAVSPATDDSDRVDFSPRARVPLSPRSTIAVKLSHATTDLTDMVDAKGLLNASLDSIPDVPAALMSLAHPASGPLPPSHLLRGPVPNVQPAGDQKASRRASTGSLPAEPPAGVIARQFGTKKSMELIVESDEESSRSPGRSLALSPVGDAPQRMLSDALLVAQSFSGRSRSASPKSSSPSPRGLGGANPFNHRRSRSRSPHSPRGRGGANQRREDSIAEPTVTGTTSSRQTSSAAGLKSDGSSRRKTEDEKEEEAQQKKSDECILSKRTLEGEDQTVEIVFVEPFKALCLGRCCHEFAWCLFGGAVLDDDASEELDRVERGFELWHIERRRKPMLKVLLLALFALQLALHTFNSATLARIQYPTTVFWDTQSTDTAEQINAAYVAAGRLQHIGGWVTVSILCPIFLLFAGYLLAYEWATTAESATESGSDVGMVDVEETEEVALLPLSERLSAKFVALSLRILPQPKVFSAVTQLSVLVIGAALIAEAAIVDLWIAFMVLACVHSATKADLSPAFVALHSCPPARPQTHTPVRLSRMILLQMDLLFHVNAAHHRAGGHLRLRYCPDCWCDDRYCIVQCGFRNTPLPAPYLSAAVPGPNRAGDALGKLQDGNDAARHLHYRAETE